MISIAISTHNPHPQRFARALEGVLHQRLPTQDWELIVVDNRSTPPVEIPLIADESSPNIHLIREERLGLAFGRAAGVKACRGELVVFLDDDMVLAPNYLFTAVKLFEADSRLGGVVGKVLPEFEVVPEPWALEFLNCLGLWDHGKEYLDTRDVPSGHYPWFVGGGGGAVFRRGMIEPMLAKLEADATNGLTGRAGGSLSSGEDNHIVLSGMEAGWIFAYSPELSALHLMPRGRLERNYLARLNRGIAYSWVGVLDRHGIRPWSQIDTWTVTPRKIRAFFKYRCWAGPGEYIRWHGACGHFEGRASLPRNDR